MNIKVRATELGVTRGVERSLLSLRREDPVLKLTRLNHKVVAINPDHIAWVDATPDTTLFLVGGEKILVRETLAELIERVIQFRRAIRSGAASVLEDDGDPPRTGFSLRKLSEGGLTNRLKEVG